MYWPSFLFILISAVNSEFLKHDLLEYFESEEVCILRFRWAKYRTVVEDTVQNLLQELSGKLRIDNILYLKSPDPLLASGYIYNQDPAEIILKNLKIDQLPQCSLPEISISLASNVLKIETKLTKIIVNGYYNILRNHSTIIKNIQEQDPYKNSPFLFENVHNIGNIALTAEHCLLSGYVVTRLVDSKVHLGHYKFTLSDCYYTAELYQPGDMSPPIIAPISAKTSSNGPEIKHLLLKPISEDIIQKLQGLVLLYINTTDIFRKKLSAIRNKQLNVFKKTERRLNEVVKDFKTKVRSGIELDDLQLSWDDLMPYQVFHMPTLPYLKGAILTLSDMILTGLDSIYLANTGGPYKLNEMMIGEQIGFNTLQVRGKLYHSIELMGPMDFSVEISDFLFKIDIFAERNSALTAEVVGYRNIEFILPKVIKYDTAQQIITGHLMNAIPKIVQNILLAAVFRDNINTEGEPTLTRTDEDLNLTAKNDDSSEEFDCSNDTIQRSGKLAKHLNESSKIQ